MTKIEPAPVTVAVPALPTEHRARVRMGFALCCAGLALAMLSMLGVIGAEMFAASSGVNLWKTYDPQMKLVGVVSEVAVNSLLIAGLVCLYLVTIAQRWRLASTLLLAMLGVDVAILCLRVAGGDAAMLALAGQFGVTLGWVELWMIAVLAAEAAESLGRADLTYQTEVAGRLIIWGGFSWLAYLIWSFDLKQLGNPSADAASDEFAIILGYCASILRLFALCRTVMFCGGLASALSPTQPPPPPGQTV